MIHSDRHENIRPLRFEDIPEILRILEPYVQSGKMVSRNAQDIEEHIEKYSVYEIDGTIHGCGALLTTGSNQGELAAVATDSAYAGTGIGKKIVESLIDRAGKESLASVFILTTQSADWFTQLGFEDGSVDNLPESRQEAYNRDRNSRVLQYTLT